MKKFEPLILVGRTTEMIVSRDLCSACKPEFRAASAWNSKGPPLRAHSLKDPTYTNTESADFPHDGMYPGHPLALKTVHNQASSLKDPTQQGAGTLRPRYERPYTHHQDPTFKF